MIALVVEKFVAITLLNYFRWENKRNRRDLYSVRIVYQICLMMWCNNRRKEVYIRENDCNKENPRDKFIRTRQQINTTKILDRKINHLEITVFRWSNEGNIIHFFRNLSIRLSSLSSYQRFFTWCFCLSIFKLEAFFLFMNRLRTLLKKIT